MMMKKRATELTGTERARLVKARAGRIDELRSKLAERARRMSWDQFSDSLLPEEYRELAFFGDSAISFWQAHNGDEILQRQAMEQPKMSHAQIKREVDKILAKNSRRHPR